MVDLASLYNNPAYVVGTKPYRESAEQALMQNAQAQAAQADTNMKNIALQTQKLMPAALEAVNGMAPNDAVNAMVSMGIPFKDSVEAVTSMMQTNIMGAKQNYISQRLGGGQQPSIPQGQTGSGQDYSTQGGVSLPGGASAPAPQAVQPQGAPDPIADTMVFGGDAAKLAQDKYFKEQAPALAGQEENAKNQANMAKVLSEKGTIAQPAVMALQDLADTIKKAPSTAFGLNPLTYKTQQSLAQWQNTPEYQSRAAVIGARAGAMDELGKTATALGQLGDTGSQKLTEILMKNIDTALGGSDDKLALQQKDAILNLIKGFTNKMQIPVNISQNWGEASSKNSNLTPSQFMTSPDAYKPSTQSIISEAKRAIAQGADPKAVAARLKGMGIGGGQ